MNLFISERASVRVKKLSVEENNIGGIYETRNDPESNCYLSNKNWCD